MTTTLTKLYRYIARCKLQISTLSNTFLLVQLGLYNSPKAGIVHLLVIWQNDAWIVVSTSHKPTYHSIHTWFIRVPNRSKVTCWNMQDGFSNWRIHQSISAQGSCVSLSTTAICTQESQDHNSGKLCSIYGSRTTTLQEVMNSFFLLSYHMDQESIWNPNSGRLLCMR